MTSRARGSSSSTVTQTPGHVPRYQIVHQPPRGAAAWVYDSAAGDADDYTAARRHVGTLRSQGRTGGFALLVDGVSKRTWDAPAAG
mmetsp:Transcript_14522/g.43546  ORF Transcript_14522/g.43546 Transcript_14522/m.43546 type:complete len:86 (+) Transcript_14522:228-485(+)